MIGFLIAIISINPSILHFRSEKNDSWTFCDPGIRLSYLALNVLFSSTSIISFFWVKHDLNKYDVKTINKKIQKGRIPVLSNICLSGRSQTSDFPHFEWFIFCSIVHIKSNKGINRVCLVLSFVSRLWISVLTYIL